MENTKAVDEVWTDCLHFIKEKIGELDYDRWFRPTKATRIDGNKITVMVPSHYFFEYIEKNFLTVLKESLKKNIGPKAQLEYAVSMRSDKIEQDGFTMNLPTSSNRGYRKNTKSFVNSGISIKNPFAIPGVKERNSLSYSPNLNLNLNFDNFVEGDCNRLARVTGISVSENPGNTSFNPLIVYGNTGLGKTHLANAIGIQTLASNPRKRVTYVSSESFTRQFIEFVRENKTSDFVNFYYSTDVLIVDDIQFFEGKEKTQEIFFHIFNNLHHNNKQIVLTCDKQPTELKGLEKRLISRFEWGLKTDLQHPDFETRVAILEKKAYNDGIKISNEIFELIAKTVTVNIRQLEGFLIALYARSMVDKKPITLDLAYNISKVFSSKKRDKYNIDEIKKTVCKYFDISLEQICSRSRKRPVVEARQIAMYLSRKYSKKTLEVIGLNLGNKKHATTLHSCNVVENLIETNTSFKKIVSEIENELTKEY